MNNTDEQLRYPIGKLVPKETYTPAELAGFIRSIEDLPQHVEVLARSLTPRQLETPYRDGGWTARQVIHHIADSHTNAYVRVKWTLTEDSPVIKAYNEKRWATTPEMDLDPVLSINLLKALHVKLAALLARAVEHEPKRFFVHPDTQKQITIERMAALYAWHGEHHLGHLRIIASMG